MSTQLKANTGLNYSNPKDSWVPKLNILSQSSPRQQTRPTQTYFFIDPIQISSNSPHQKIDQGQASPVQNMKKVDMKNQSVKTEAEPKLQLCSPVCMIQYHHNPEYLNLTIVISYHQCINVCIETCKEVNVNNSIILFEVFTFCVWGLKKGMHTQKEKYSLPNLVHVVLNMLGPYENTCLNAF